MLPREETSDHIDMMGGEGGVAIAGGRPKLTKNDALHYLKVVEAIFQDNTEKYYEFLELLKDFKAQRIDVKSVIARVKELFKGHQELISGFNNFLPNEYEIILASDDEQCLGKKSVELADAVNFMNKLKMRFQGNDHVYTSFLDIMDKCGKKKKSIIEVFDEVAALFDGHTDLLRDFVHFLPDTSASSSVNYISSGQFQDRSSGKLPMWQMHVYEGGDNVGPTVSASGVVPEGAKTQRYNEESVGSSEIEIKEVELSPN